MADDMLVSSTFGAAPTSAVVTECLELLLWETPFEALQIVVHTLGNWLTEQEMSIPDKEILVGQFAQRVYETIEAGSLQHRVPPSGFVWLAFDFKRRQTKANQILAHLHELSRDKALDFLAKVTGLWVLSYPEQLLRQDASFQSEHEAWVQNDEDLIFVLRYWLGFALDGGWTERFFVGPVPERFLNYYSQQSRIRS